MEEKIIDCTKIKTREDLHRIFRETLVFPEWYGNNLDALHDCLMERNVMEIEVEHAEEMLAALGKYGEKLMQVLDDVKNK